jgi:hypothetical protein
MRLMIGRVRHRTFVLESIADVERYAAASVACLSTLDYAGTGAEGGVTAGRGILAAA